MTNMPRPAIAAWREIGYHRCYFRSRMEANYARWLEYQCQQGMIYTWEHEPHTFWFESIKRGVRSYLPDFKVWLSEDEYYWVEVKGYWDAKSLTKVKRMRKYYPEEKLVLVDGKWFAENSSKLRMIIPEWEIGENSFQSGSGGGRITQVKNKATLKKKVEYV